MKRTFTAIVCTLLLVAVLAGCGSTNPFDAAAKTFSNEGMTITLTSDFSKQSMDGYTVCYAAKTAAVFALHETNDQFAAAGLNDVTLEQYAALVMQNNSGRLVPGWDAQAALLAREGVTLRDAQHVDLRRYQWQCE